jgi:hypothetical protein
MDTRAAEFSECILTSLKLKEMERRCIFKKAMEGILTQRVPFRKKRGFEVLSDEWLLYDRQFERLVQNVLDDPRTR